MAAPDPFRLARRQLARDRERMRRWPRLFAHKCARMRRSPFAFLRGTAPLFWELLAECGSLRRGPAGRGWLQGDAHLENFGVFRPGGLVGAGDPTAPEVVFDLADFDDAAIGPCRHDVLRMTASLLLAAREQGLDASLSLQAAGALARAHAEHLFAADAPSPPVPAAVAALLARAQERTRRDLLDARTEVVAGKRRFERGRRYLDVSAAWVRRIAAALPRYVARLPADERPAPAAMRVLDVAWRVAGTGSLGRRRFAVLVAGKGGRDGAWVFECKEEGAPAGDRLLDDGGLAGGKRVVAAMRACLQHAPRWLGSVRAHGLSLLVRRLLPQEDKLEVAALTADAAVALAAFCGARLGDAHRRGAERLPRRWSRGEVEDVVEKAARVAGVLETAWLAYFDAVDG